MNPDDQWKALAELDGWTITVDSRSKGYKTVLRGHKRNGSGDGDWAIPNYIENPSFLFQLEKRVGLHDKGNLELRIDWVNALREIVGRRMPTNKLGKPVTSDIDLLMAETSERIEALLVAKKLWPKTPKKKIS